MEIGSLFKENTLKYTWIHSMIRSIIGSFHKQRAQKGPQNAIILVVGTPRKSASDFWKPYSHAILCHSRFYITIGLHSPKPLKNKHVEDP